MSDSVAKDILDVLRKHSIKEDPEYVNPHFLQEISGVIYNYYLLEDDDLDDWVREEFGR